MHLRYRFLLVVASVLLVLPALSGCKKKGKTSGSTASALGALPKDATMAFGVDLAKAKSAKLLSELVTKVQEDMPAKAKEAKEKCGVDPTDMIKSMVIAVKDPDDEKTAFAALTMSINKAKAKECAEKLGMKVEEKGKLVVYSDDGEKMTGYWASDNLLIASGYDGANEETFKPVLTNPGLDKASELHKMIDKANTGAIVWAAGSLPAQVSMMAKGGKGFYASVDGSTDLSINAAMIFEQEDQAKQIKTMADSSMPQLAMFLGDAAKNIKVGQSGPELTISAKFSSAELDDLKKKFGAQLGGMMGGGM